MRRNRNIYPVMPIFRREKEGGSSGLAKLPYSALIQQINPYPDAQDGSPNYWENYGDSPLGVFDMYGGKDPMVDINDNFESTFDVVTRRYGTKENAFFDIHNMISGLCIAKHADTGGDMTCAVISTYAKIPESSEYLSPVFTVSANSDMVDYGVMSEVYSVTNGRIPETSEFYHMMPSNTPHEILTVQHDGVTYNNFYFYDRSLITAASRNINSPDLIYPEAIKSACVMDAKIIGAGVGAFENDGYGNIRKTGAYSGVVVTHQMVHLRLPGENT